MSGQVSRGSAGEYQADERAGVASRGAGEPIAPALSPRAAAGGGVRSRSGYRFFGYLRILTLIATLKLLVIITLATTSYSLQ